MYDKSGISYFIIYLIISIDVEHINKSYII